MLTRGRRERDRGAVTILVALFTCLVLFLVAALTVDLGNTWARRGQLQLQVDRAVKFAAERLPVDSTTVAATPSSTQLTVAEAAAYYLACHPVSGQASQSTIPACPAAGADYTADPGIVAFAQRLLDNGRTGATSPGGALTFPTVNQVSLVTPRALVTYGFGRLAGVTGSGQQRNASAVVLSPGQVLPIGMSLTCMANAVGTAPLGAGDTASTVMPVNYLSDGTGTPLTNPTVTTSTDTTPTYWDDISQSGSHPATISLQSSSINSASGLVTLTFGWASSRTGWTVTAQQIFIRKAGYTSTSTTGAYAGPVVLGLTSPTAPYSVRLPPGNYEALIRVTGTNATLTQTDTWTNNPNQNVKFTVPDVGQLAHYVACARPAQSPRLGIASDSDAMAVNIAQGLDHGLQAFPGLADAVDGTHIGVGAGTSVASATSLLGSAGITALTCGTNTAVKKDYPTRRTDEPNCVHVDTATDWSAEVTKGLLTGGTFATGSVTGRLRCPTSGNCNYNSSRAVLSNPGGISGTYNNDHFSDFIKSGPSGGPSYLSDPFLMALDLMISPTVPLLTPPNTTLQTALYSSPRFFWAPYVVSAWTTPGAADYSVLTFRPVFLTSDASSTITTPIDTLLLSLINSSTSGGLSLLDTLTAFGASASCLAMGASACELSMLKQNDVSGYLGSYLGATTVDVGGLVIDSAAARVRAARIMTLTPGALPAVPDSYTGPTTDYLGVGPKIVRLTR
ncbi:MAG: TadE/TadG family type IV pilus assembly protein [Nocardioides sp.]